MPENPSPGVGTISPPAGDKRGINMATEDILRRRSSFLGSFLGLFLSWLGILAIIAGIAWALKELGIFTASWHTLKEWGLYILAITAGIYAVSMFAITWSFTRFLGIQFLMAAAFAIWCMIPVFNIIPMVLLIFIASRQIGKTDVPA